MFAGTVIVSAMLVRWLLAPWFGATHPFLLFYPAVMLASWYGGLGPGILASVLSTIVGVVVFQRPAAADFVNAATFVPGMVFLATGGLIAQLNEQMHRTAAAQRASEARIAAQYESLRAAQLAQHLLAAIVESSDDAIVGKDLNGIVTSWNNGAERLYGYTAGEMIGRSIRTIVPREREQEEDDSMTRIRAGRRVDHLETVRLHRDGSLVDVSVTISPIKDPSGVIVGASNITRDITERRRVERMREELLAREQRARDRLAFLAEIGVLLASSLDYEETLGRAVRLALPRLGDYCNVLVADERGQLRHVAAAHADREKEPALLELVRRLTEGTSPAVPTFAEAVMKAGRTLVVTHEMLLAAVADRNVTDPDLLRLGDVLRPYAYVGVPLLARGIPVGVLSFGTAENGSKREYDAEDVGLIEEFARRVSSAVENARLFRQADELNRLKDEFLATLSHELRTPLAAILGWARILGGGHLDPAKSAQAIEAIERNANLQAQLVDDILDVARGMAGHLRLSMERVNLADVARRAVDSIAPAAAAKHIEVALGGAAAVTVVGDERRLQQIAWNLLSNAVKFTPRDGRVAMDVGTADGQAELRVTDTGVGIPPSFLPFVFDKFRQADSSYTRQHGGLGLGLAIARHLTELHGGTIEARSEGEGRGSTFIVRLPLPPEPPR